MLAQPGLVGLKTPTEFERRLREGGIPRGKQSSGAQIVSHPEIKDVEMPGKDKVEFGGADFRRPRVVVSRDPMTWVRPKITANAPGNLARK